MILGRSMWPPGCANIDQVGRRWKGVRRSGMRGDGVCPHPARFSRTRNQEVSLEGKTCRCTLHSKGRLVGRTRSGQRRLRLQCTLLCCAPDPPRPENSSACLPQKVIKFTPRRTASPSIVPSSQLSHRRGQRTKSAKSGRHGVSSCGSVLPYFGVLSTDCLSVLRSTYSCTYVPVFFFLSFFLLTYLLACLQLASTVLRTYRQRGTQLATILPHKLCES